MVASIAVYATCKPERLGLGLQRLQKAGFTKVWVAPASQWRGMGLELKSMVPGMTVCLERENVNYEDGYLVAFARLIWRAQSCLVMNDGSRKSKAVAEMAKRMSCIRNVKLIEVH